jgi:V/A-type H+/Na+-transporting ATPase subunit E
MEKKLQELTEKIYAEGVGKANDEAAKIISSAKSEAEQLLKKATQDAETIRLKAQKEAEDYKNSTMSELQMAARQALSSLKQQVGTLITVKSTESVKESFAEKSFVQNLIAKALGNWSLEKSENFDLAVILPKSDEEAMQTFFKNSQLDLLNKGLVLNFSDKIKAGFKIGPKDGSYLISFTDEDFVSFFRSYLRGKTAELLFGGK